MLPLISPTHLMDCLVALPPVSLTGLVLLTTPDRLTDRAAVRDAVLELIVYTRHCQQAAQRLSAVPPVPLTAFVIPEWCV